MLTLKKQYSLLDRVLIQANRCLQTLSSDLVSKRAYPAATVVDVGMSEQQRKQSAAFMRINHCGEVCAQALYDAQAFVARNSDIRQTLQACGDEESDHLAWCEQRLDELDSRPSYLNVFWYGNSFAMGLLAGIAGDSWSLGFVEETEIQVGRHLQSHLDQIQQNDPKSQAIIEQMQIDEAKHAQTAADNGAASLPQPIKWLMRAHAKVMTTLAYWV